MAKLSHVKLKKRIHGSFISSMGKFIYMLMEVSFVTKKTRIKLGNYQQILLKVSYN
jgi:hypothetical protein